MAQRMSCVKYRNLAVVGDRTLCIVAIHATVQLAVSRRQPNQSKPGEIMLEEGKLSDLNTRRKNDDWMTWRLPIISIPPRSANNYPIARFTRESKYTAIRMNEITRILNLHGHISFTSHAVGFPVRILPARSGPCRKPSSIQVSWPSSWFIEEPSSFDDSPGHAIIRKALQGRVGVDDRGDGAEPQCVQAVATGHGRPRVWRTGLPVRSTVHKPHTLYGHF